MVAYPLVFILLLIATSAGVTLYDESISGDLSNSSALPTALGELTNGENVVVGVLNEESLFNYPDVFSFSISSGYVLSSITFSIDSSDQAHFLAFHDSAGEFTYTDEYLFAALVSSNQNGSNILDTFADGGSVAQDNGLPAPRGYTLPLGEGDYALWFQETNQQEINYTFTLTTVAVPEPSSLTLLLVTSWGTLLRRRRNFFASHRTTRLSQPCNTI